MGVAYNLKEESKQPYINKKLIYLYPDRKEAKKHNNKKSGKKSEVYAIEIGDMKKITDYFCKNEKWLYYLIFVISCNMARRINDTLSLTWENFYNPSTGKFRTDLELQEQKTDKYACLRINSACRNAIELYIEKTGCNPSNNLYKEPVFKQLSGNYKGRTVTDDGYRKALKKAGVAVGIEYNIGTHSPRKAFGAISRMLHPEDHDSMQILQKILNHSDEKTTMSYIGLTKKKMDGYFDDVGDFFNDYIVGDKECLLSENTAIVSIDGNDLRDLIKMAYEFGLQKSESDNISEHLEVLNYLWKEIDTLRK